MAVWMVKTNIHSMIDLITNSSTELFVGDKERSIELVKEILQCAIDLHNKVEDSNFKFEDIFDEPYFGSCKDTLNGWEDYYPSHNYGDELILRGADDNSIPYWMHEFIESTFSARRYHLG